MINLHKIIEVRHLTTCPLVSVVTFLELIPVIVDYLRVDFALTQCWMQSSEEAAQ